MHKIQKWANVIIEVEVMIPFEPEQEITKELVVEKFRANMLQDGWSHVYNFRVIHEVTE